MTADHLKEWLIDAATPQRLRFLFAATLLAQSPRPATPPAGKVKGVPLIEVPARAPGGDELAVLLSGDGGWAVTDRGIADRLSKGGIPVVGWNALRYFFKQKKADRAARDLERVLRTYLPLWHKEKVILIGRASCRERV